MPVALPLEVTGLTAGYGLTRIVEEVTFALAAGARMALLGRNGVGKTTLLASLVGLTRYHGGQIRLGGVDVTGRVTSERARAGLGYVPQTRDVFRSLTVEENLLVGLNGRPRTELERAFTLFPRLKERRGNLASQLSGGEQQMLSTARAILGQPAVLLLDEPLEGLAPVVCDELMHSFQALADEGRTTVVLVEQQIERALAFADEVLFMERGRVVWFGPAAAARAEPVIVERYVGLEH